MPYPALVASHAGIWLAGPDGRVGQADRREAMARAADTPHLLLNAPVTAARLGYPALSGLDVLELFAFVAPARFVVPSAAGLAGWLGLAMPADGAAEALFLRQAAGALLARVAPPDWAARAGAWNSAQSLARLGWGWAPLLLERIARPEAREPGLFESLRKWEETAPRPKPRPVVQGVGDVDAALDALRGERREVREGQRGYARAVAHAFAPRLSADGPNMVVAEAGTGIGKTLGYLAPAADYAAKSGGAVWLSTFTRALQRQLDAETVALFPDAGERAQRVVVRKGRENYLCLLNLEDAMQGAFTGRAGVFAHLVARFARYSRDGDMVGGDLPGWLPGLFSRGAGPALTDRRGECVYAACPHYRSCFIERAVRASAGADLVIANHALVMANAVRGRAEGQGLERLVFDEGHHLADAADGAFALALTGAEAIELRRWLLGPERNARGRRRGLAARLLDVSSYDEAGAAALEAVAGAARALPGDGWLGRLGEGVPDGPVEALLAAVRDVVLTRAEGVESGFTLETEIADPPGALVEAAQAAAGALERLGQACARLRARLLSVLDEPPDWLDAAAFARVTSASDGLLLRQQLLAAWGALLARIGGAGNPAFVDWFELVRHEGRELDTGVRRHWLDPTKPLADAVLAPAHGVVVTSATLGEQGVGEAHLAVVPRHFQVASPFDYARQARVLIVTDVKRGDVAALANAYARLIAASGGGTLGLFTAISRLRSVHARLADTLARQGLPLFAQHVDPVDAGTLVDLFRADPRASLFGTDALRDGVDVPGESLRQVVLEGLPWSRPTVLHAARRAANGGAAYEDALVRRRLAQAFGRLIRRADDRGVFVLLGPAVPSRLLNAFPPEVGIERVTLGEAVESVSGFIGAGCAGDGAPVSMIGGSREA